MLNHQYPRKGQIYLQCWHGTPLKRLGYDLSEEDQIRVYVEFMRLAGTKEVITSPEIDVIVASYALQVPPAYALAEYIINASNVFSASAHIRLKKNGEVMESVALGDGPVDASFLAIEQIAGVHYELDDFQIRAVTEGREAMGEALVKLRVGGKIYSGRGLSTDIIGSSISAYINALNKIVYEEENE
jgi:2-isopropylmalate synthase